MKKNIRKIVLLVTMFALSTSSASAANQFDQKFLTQMQTGAAPATCYMSGAVFNFVKELGDPAPADRTLGTMKFQLVPDKTRCIVVDKVFKMESLPFVLEMRYRAPCNGWGANYSGRLTDDKYNNLFYSKYDRDGSHIVFADSHFISGGKTYHISFTCF